MERRVVDEERDRQRRPEPERPDAQRTATSVEEHGGDQPCDDEPGEGRTPVEEREQRVRLVDDRRGVARVAVVDDDALPELADDAEVGDDECQPDYRPADRRRDESAPAQRALPAEQDQERRHGQHRRRLQREGERDRAAAEERERGRPPPPRLDREPEGKERHAEGRHVGEHAVGVERERRRDRQQGRSAEPGGRPTDRAAEQVRGKARRDRDHDHADVEAAHRVGAGDRDQPQQQVPAGRLRREDVLAQPLPVLERVDAREVDALVEVGVGADEAAEQERLRDDEPGQGHELGDARSHRSKSYAGRTIAPCCLRRDCSGARSPRSPGRTRSIRPRRPRSCASASAVSPDATSSRR